jgi:hypothetical protein
MAERCELCGARWEVGTSTCRDCGSRRRITVPPGESSASMPGIEIVRSVLASASAPAASTSSSDLVARVDATLPPAVPTPLPAGLSQPLARPAGSRVLLLLVAATGVAVASGVAIWLAIAPPAETEAKLAPVDVGGGALSGCAQLEALAGSWVFTTVTTGARRTERLGVRGFYRLEIEVDGCTARATVAKTGRTDRKAFDDHKIPRAEATLTQGQGAEAYGWTGAFVLRNEDGQGIDTQFVFAPDAERLVGSWRQLGERWASSGLYGVLEGRREGDPTAILPERSNQPCAVRCATPEDIGRIDAPDEAAQAACLAECE